MYLYGKSSEPKLMKKIFRLIMATSVAIAAASCANTNNTTEVTKVVVEPGEQAPLADPGQKNFGGSAVVRRDIDTTGMAERMRKMREEMNKIRTVHFNDLSMSDPFIIPDPETQTYYLTSTGGRPYSCKDVRLCL